MSTRKPRRRIGFLYVAAWVPYLGMYASAFWLSGEAPAGPALLAGVNSVLPAALFGLGVLWICQRLPWGSQSPGRFIALHGGAAALYAGVTAMGIGVMFVATFPVFEEHLAQEASGFAMVAWQFFMGLMVYTVLASVSYAFQSTARLREEEHRAAQAEALKANAELQALRAQLNPHFLFNTLHSLIALVRDDSAAAEDAIEQFADLMRYASRVQQETRDEVTFSQEWEFVRNYLALESLRIGDRLRVHAEIDEDAEECVVPSFCLQPLVENAIRHAIAPRASGGTMWIRAATRDGVLDIEVKDDGPGAKPDAPTSNARQGLRLVRQRLEALYGERAGFEILTSPGQGFAIRVTVPIQYRTPVAGRVTETGGAPATWSAP